MADPRAPRVDGQTIGQVLRESAQRFGPIEALVFPQDSFRCTFEEFDRLVDDVARSLIALGFEHEDHFGVWSTNRPAWVLLQFATARVGVVLVTLNPSYREYELCYTLKQSDIRGLALIDRFKTSDYLGMIASLCPELSASPLGGLRAERFPRLRWVVSLQGQAPAGMMGWAEFLEAGRGVSARELARREARVRPDEPINIQYTSGTTGSPKGAMLSHRNLLMNGYHAGRNMRIGAGDRIGIPVPLYHCFGCVLGTIVSVIHGASMVFPHESFLPGATLDALEHERCSAIYGVPTMFIAMLEHESYRGRDLSSLRTGIMAGSPCPIELMRKVSSGMGASEITIGYGQTEASPLITQTRWDDPVERR
ncbi:MAG TPA: AMP-binding protein, partial [Isosphaeraceae bacterium]|nr:AMP-binding protein [Isosphaeraceae bacterium]